MGTSLRETVWGKTIIDTLAITETASNFVTPRRRAFASGYVPVLCDCGRRFALTKITWKRRAADNQLSAFHTLLIQSALARVRQFL